ncbi:MAG: aminopeptidase [bacterium]|nr:aminopeptidase [bacterium]
MNTKIVEKYAALLTHYCLALKAGDTVLVRTTTGAEPLLAPLYAEMLRAGAMPVFEIKFQNQDRVFYENATELSFSSAPFLYKHAVEGFDAMLTIDVPISTKELAHIDPAKKSKHQAAQSATRELFFNRSAAGDLRWSLCVYPTESAAKECAMSLSEYTTFIEDGCMLNAASPESEWRALGDRQSKIVGLLSQFSQFRYKSKGTDISFSTKGRTWINSDGKRNMPSGEVFTSPVRRVSRR